MSAGNWVTIAVALIGLLGTIITVYVGNKKQTEILVFRIGELEKKQEKYNHLQDRVAGRELHDARYDERMQEMSNDIKMIKKKIFKEQ